MGGQDSELVNQKFPQSNVILVVHTQFSALHPHLDAMNQTINTEYTVKHHALYVRHNNCSKMHVFPVLWFRILSNPAKNAPQEHPSKNCGPTEDL